MGARWDDPPRAPQRVIAMRFVVDDTGDDLVPNAHERLAQLMEGHAVAGARFVGVMLRDRRLFVDRGGELREIAPLGGD